MVSPMREKRAWPTCDRDAETKESAAFEATVAVAKDTVARSGEMLVSVKEDLTDHQRWLEAQSAAVQSDRVRHDRWLQRQRDYQEAMARRERARRRRQLMRQRAVRAVERAIAATGLFVRSLFWLVVAKIKAGLFFVAGAIANAVLWALGRLVDLASYLASLCRRAAAWIASQVRTLTLWLGRQISAGTSSTAAKARAFGRWTGGQVSAGSAWGSATSRALALSGSEAVVAGSSAVSTRMRTLADTGGKKLSAGSSALSAKADVLVRSGSEIITAGSSALTTRMRTFADTGGKTISEGSSVVLRSSGEASSSGYATLADRASRLSHAGRQSLADIHAAAAAKAAALARRAKESVGAAWAWLNARMQSAAPALYVWVAKVSRQAERYAALGAASAQRTFARAEAAAPGEDVDLASPGSREKGLSLPGPIRDVNLSQMLIIAGTVFLVCGVLMLGGGLMLRAGTPVERAESPHAIIWLFEEPDLALVDRIVFTLSGSPESFRINGLSINAENASDQPLKVIEGTVRPDVQRPLLKLTVSVDKTALQPGGIGSGEVEVPVFTESIPPRAPFKLVFAFPPEAMDGEDGITVEEFFESYGGLTLKVYYEFEGHERALIQYLPPDMLRAQLAEVRNLPDST